jgi:hypothetical protein
VGAACSDGAANVGKLVFYVPNATTVIEAIRARGLAIMSEPTPQAAFNNVFLADAAAVSARVAREGLPILTPPTVFDVLGTKALIS